MIVQGNQTHCSMTAIGKLDNNTFSTESTTCCEEMLHTDKKVAAQIPAKIPYRVDLEISIGPTLPSVLGLAGTATSGWGRRGSRSDGMLAAMTGLGGMGGGRVEERRMPNYSFVLSGKSARK